MRQPWFRFFPGDWRQCPELSGCSLEARGLWIELLARAHQTEPYGHVLYQSLEELALDIRRPPQEVIRAFAELEQRGVFARAGARDVFSRKMVRDEQRRAQNAENGALGGNPGLVPENGGRITDRISGTSESVAPPSEAIVRSQIQIQNQSPDSSPSEKKARKRAVVFVWQDVLSEFPTMNTAPVQAAAAAYLEARQVKHGTWTAQGMRIGIRKFVKGGPESLRSAFERATEGPWQTLWPEKNGTPTNGHTPTTTPRAAQAAYKPWTGYQ